VLRNGAIQRRCGGFSLSEPHIWGPKGGGAVNLLKCTFCDRKKTGSGLHVMAAAEMHPYARVSNLCCVLAECRDAVVVSACLCPTFGALKGGACEFAKMYFLRPKEDC
jgi:hypothetical protein